MKTDRLNNLPPAARVAMVSAYEAAGCLQIKTRYVRKPYDGGRSHFVYPGKELWGVPYDVWKQHEGRRPIRLWEWHGTGEGMMGGPTKREADFTFFGSLWEFPHHFSSSRLLRHAEHLEEWLADERYEFSPRCRAELEAKIASDRRLAAIEGWDAMDSIWKWGHARGLGGPMALTACDDDEL